MGSMEKPFYLKHFTLHQEYTTQRVGTDALLLGAWPFVHSLPEQARILDVGTGTGIVSLMMAQRFAGAQEGCRTKLCALSLRLHPPSSFARLSNGQARGLPSLRPHHL